MVATEDRQEGPGIIQEMNTVGEFLETQIPWSIETFGEGIRTEGICRHIESELVEIRENPHDLEEWIDVIILAFDGAWRTGHDVGEIVQMLFGKQFRNIHEREWASEPPPETEPSFHTGEKS